MYHICANTAGLNASVAMGLDARHEVQKHSSEPRAIGAVVGFAPPRTWDWVCSSLPVSANMQSS